MLQQRTPGLRYWRPCRRQNKSESTEHSESLMWVVSATTYRNNRKIIAFLQLARTVPWCITLLLLPYPRTATLHNKKMVLATTVHRKNDPLKERRSPRKLFRWWYLMPMRNAAPPSSSCRPLRDYVVGKTRSTGKAQTEVQHAFAAWSHKLDDKTQKET